MSIETRIYELRAELDNLEAHRVELETAVKAQKHTIKITQLVEMTYTVEIRGELTRENIKEQFAEYSYPDADTMETMSNAAWGENMAPVYFK